MKYIVVLVIIVLLARIDVLLRYFDKYTTKVENSQPVDVELVKSSRITIPMSEDTNLKQTTKSKFFSLLDNFHASPSADARNAALEVLKLNPEIFTQVLDVELEQKIYKWRDLVLNGEPELMNFLLELLQTLQGENQATVRKFISFWLDANVDQFIVGYSRSKDPNCAIALMFGDPLTDEEKMTALIEREEALKTYLVKDKLDPIFKQLATNCLSLVTSSLNQLQAKVFPLPDPVASPITEPPPVPAPTQAPTP